MKLEFIKMTAIGNDFIMVDGRVHDADTIIPKAEFLCDRRFGIGGDGVIFILPGENGADFTMRIINSDGSEPEMCGNGIRCFARWLDEHGEFTGDELNVNTLAGIKVITRENGGYRVNMGIPELEPAKIPVKTINSEIVDIPFTVNNEALHFTAVSMGNPHAVFFTKKITDEQVLTYGPEIEIDNVFPNKTNVEFIKVLSSTETEMRVWERGCGETLACGTGACASVVAGILNGLHGNDVTVHLRGGDLHIQWNGDDINPEQPVFMTGGADIVFRGAIEL